jgi:predicted phage terminase large subunit-like protein
MESENEKELQAIIEMMVKEQKFRRVLGRQNFRMFFCTYFSHYITRQFAPFHRQMFNLAQDESNRTIVIMAARNSAKSSIMNTGLAIWSVLGDPQKHLVILASRTREKAKQHFMNTRKELENNTLLRSDLGPFKTEESQWGSVIELTEYDAQIIFASVEQDLRGIRYKQYRPDLLIADDIEDSNSVKTIDGRNSTYDWLARDTIPAGDLEKLRVVLLGTLLHEDSVMVRFKKDIETKRRDGVYREYPLMDAAGNVLWKAKYPDAATIEAERLQVGSDKAWSQEFLLRIMSDHDRVVHPEWIHYGESPLPIEANDFRGTFIGIDPAISEEKRACCTAIVCIRVFGWGDQMKIYVQPYPVNERMGMFGIVEKVKPLVEEHLKVGMVKIYSEDVAFQKALIEALQRNGYIVQGVKPRGDKRERLSLISHQIKDGTIQFAPRGNEELIMQVVNFGSEKFMDLVDALSMLVPEVVQTHAGHVPFSRLHKDENVNPTGVKGYKSPYEVDIEEEGHPGGMHYDPELEGWGKTPITAGLLHKQF